MPNDMLKTHFRDLKLLDFIVENYRLNLLFNLEVLGRLWFT